MATVSVMRLPLRCEKNAPYFSGNNPKEIKRFLEDVAALVELCEGKGAPDRRKIEKAKYYSSQEVEELLEVLTEDKWSDFESVVVKLYNGSAKQFTRGTLVRLVNQQVMNGMPDKAAMLKYYREFMTQAGHIPLLGSAETCTMFTKGLPTVIRENLKARLKRKHIDHYPEDPYTLDDMLEGLEWLYDEEAVVLGWRGMEGGNRGEEKPGEEKGKVEGERVGVVEDRRSGEEGGERLEWVRVKAEYAALSEALAGLIDKLAMTGKTPAGHKTSPVSPAAIPGEEAMLLSSAIQPRPKIGAQFPQSSLRCRFCDRSNHSVRNCPVVEEYTAAGKCDRNSRGQVTLPNGRCLPKSAHGKNLKEGFDNFYSQVHCPVIAEELCEVEERQAEYQRLTVLLAEAKGRLEKKRRGKFLGAQADIAACTQDTTPAVLVAKFSASQKPENHSPAIVGSASLPLRCVDAVVEGRLLVECVIDPGSGIVAMRKEIWEQLGSPPFSENALVMEAVNGSKTSAMGLLKNLDFSLGGMHLKLQVLVFDKVPFDILLGRPFQAHTQCRTKDFPSGNQYITICDPHTRRLLTIPTRARQPKVENGVKAGIWKRRKWNRQARVSSGEDGEG